VRCAGSVLLGRGKGGQERDSVWPLRQRSTSAAGKKAGCWVLIWRVGWVSSLLQADSGKRKDVGGTEGTLANQRVTEEFMVL